MQTLRRYMLWFLHVPKKAERLLLIPQAWTDKRTPYNSACVIFGVFVLSPARNLILTASTTSSPDRDDLAQQFVAFAVQCGVLRFGEFTTKAGRQSPYFFNAGLFNGGAMLGQLARFYAQRIVASGMECDMLFGPAYKGIPLVAAVAIELARMGRNLPFAYNRKEAKDHGEGGSLVGAPLKGRVLIVDDVMSAGTAVRESIALIRAANATPAAVAVALDRQEKATENGQDVPYSAVQYVRTQLGMQVCAIATLDDLLGYLSASSEGDLANYYQQVLAYRAKYGVH